MIDEKTRQFSKLLDHLAVALDISDKQTAEAIEHYEAVAGWLGHKDSPLAPFDPDLYPQGSFRLGTVVRPISDADEYDVDLVCALSLSKNDITQQGLKGMVGDRIKANAMYEKMVDKEKPRCWRLNYADGTRFHMDILPAIPEDDNGIAQLMESGVPREFAVQAICITDKNNWNYDLYDRDWPRSNPKGYGEWFKIRMKNQFEARKAILAQERNLSIEAVPDYQIKTPLQRSIQILKRHRDIKFRNASDDKPISMIITTLAALAYQNEADIYSALTNIVDRIERYVDTGLITKRNGEWWIPNPANLRENFADRWHEQDGRKARAFFWWLASVKQDIAKALSQEGIHKIAESMKSEFSERAVEQAIKGLGDSFKTQRETLGLKMAAGTGMLGQAGHTAVKEHTFYGS